MRSTISGTTNPRRLSLDGVPSNLGLDSLAHRSEISCRRCTKMSSAASVLQCHAFCGIVIKPPVLKFCGSGGWLV